MTNNPYGKENNTSMRQLQESSKENQYGNNNAFRETALSASVLLQINPENFFQRTVNVCFFSQVEIN